MKRILCLTVVAALVAAAVAMAAKPVKGATYTGTIVRSVGNSSFPISFKVSKNGKTVSGFKLANDYPIYCQGGGFPTLGTGRAAKISKKGTFMEKLPLKSVRSPGTGEGSVIITGKFAGHGSVSGKVKTDIGGTTFKNCNGTSPFTAAK